MTTNLPLDEWTEVFGSERLTGALLDRLTHHVHILEMNGESYRLKRSREGVASHFPSSAARPPPLWLPAVLLGGAPSALDFTPFQSDDNCSYQRFRKG